MIYTSTNMENFDSTSEFDVVIIGSGAGGAIAAARLARSGLNVLIVEEGRYVSFEDFDQDDSKLIPMLYRRSAALASDDFGIKILQGRAWGGSTTVNWMSSFRTPDNVLEEWETEFGIEEYQSDHLKTHFDSIENRLNVHNEPLENMSAHNLVLRTGATNLGLHTDVIPNNSKDCIGCGSCGLGCHYDAKQDMRLTYLADALRDGAVAITETRAQKIIYNDKKHQEIILQHIPYGQKEVETTYRISTTSTVVAGSAIFSPLILQASGLAKSKYVGEYLHVHPVTATVGFFEEDIFPSYGIPQTIYSKEYGNYDGNGYGWWLEVADIEPFLVGVNFPATGPTRKEAIEDLTKLVAVITLVRDGANRKSNGSVKWKRGFNHKSASFSLKPIPSINYRLRGPDLEHMKLGLKNNLEVQFAAGAKKVYTPHHKNNLFYNAENSEKLLSMAYGPNKLSLFTAHPMGTCRIGANPEQSVVGQDLQMHHYPGVYVMDGSVLPTALGVNPMLTILATVSRGIELSDLV